MSTVSSIASLTLDLPPSCIAFCPSRSELFVVGTYFLHPRDNAQQTESSSEDSAGQNAAEASHLGQEQKRTGSLILFRLDRDEKM